MHQFLDHVPVWVWLLLTALVWLGVQRSQPRRMPFSRAVLLPLLMCAMSLLRLSGGGHGTFDSLSWFGAFALFACLGQLTAYARGWQLETDGARVSIVGSWWPLCLILATFCTRFAYPALLVYQPALHGAIWFNALFAGLSGACGGLFIAPVLRVLRVQYVPRHMLG